MSDIRIFDAHTHVYPDAIAPKAAENLAKFYAFTVHGTGVERDLEEEARRAGVSGFFLLGVATGAHQVSKVNDTLAYQLALAREHGFTAEGFAAMHQDLPDKEAELARCEAMGFRGVKIHPDIQGVDADDPRLMPVYAWLEEHGSSIFFHVGDNRPQYRFSEPKKIARIARQFPRLRVIASHLGGYMNWEENNPLYGMENVWYDCSSALWAMSPEEAAQRIRRCGTKRVFYGTDYPVMHLDVYYDLFRRVPLTETEREDILWNNAAEFLG